MTPMDFSSGEAEGVNSTAIDDDPGAAGRKKTRFPSRVLRYGLGLVSSIAAFTTCTGAPSTYARICSNTFSKPNS